MLLTRISIAILIFSILVMGCDEDSGIVPDSPASIKIHLLFAPAAQQAEITRVVLNISAQDMETLEFEMDIEEEKAVAMIFAPSGENRRFTVSAYSGNRIEYEAEELVELLEPGKDLSLELRLQPVGLSVRIVPSEITASVGGTFDVEVTVGGMTDLFGYSFELECSADLLETVEVTQGDFLGNDSLFLSQTDPDTLSIGATRKAGTVGMSGSGVIARITFRCITPGQTELRFIRNDDFAFHKEDGTDVDNLDQIAIGNAGVTIE